MIRLLLYIMLLFSGTVCYAGDSLIRYIPPTTFAEHGVKGSYKDAHAKANINSTTNSKRYKTRILATCKAEGVNFAGHYCFVSWGCGSSCKMSVVVDMVTGKVYDGPEGTRSYEFRKNSRMVMLNAPQAEGFLNGGKEGYYRADCAWCIPEVWVWDEQGKCFYEYRDEKTAKH